MLDDQNVLEETAIIISADHGENLGELNIYGDHQTADQITCRVPLVVSWPPMLAPPLSVSAEVMLLVPVPFSAPSAVATPAPVIVIDSPTETLLSSSVPAVTVVPFPLQVAPRPLLLVMVSVPPQPAAGTAP